MQRRAKRPGFDFRQVLYFPKRTDRLWGPPSVLSNGYRGAPSPEVKQSGRKADHSPPFSAEVNVWSYISTPLYVFMTCCLINHRGNVTFPRAVCPACLLAACVIPFSCLAYFSILMTGTICSSETSVDFTRTTRRHISEHRPILMSSYLSSNSQRL
jgi:hypothetical protein